ncbi:glycoside hydrolase family 3 N-terminal domain-containing protein [Sphingomonas sp. ASV193]|uniref:glycoside hydrolase family 3 N-terminal domain-containing protein n=1 Tax=Sphingomonas sp. ASV193 TaxID=3144405 RepID=UPI0032E879AE
MRRTMMIALCCGVALAAVGNVARAAPSGPATVVRPAANALYRDPRLPVAARVADLMKRMTLEEKVAQLETLWETKAKVQTVDGRFDAEAASRNFPDGIGGIARPSDRRGVSAGNGAAGATSTANRGARETADYVDAAQHWAVERTRLGIPILTHEEALHGYVAPGATSFPQAIALASSWDPALSERIFSVAAREMRARGAFLALAPVVDVARDPRWGRIEETYGEDPYLVTQMSLGAISGFQGTRLPLAPDKVLVTLKHLTGHGQPESGTNTGPAEISERTLREYFFPPFEHAVSELPVRAVMPSYNEIDGVPSHVNKWLLTDVLRGEWGFKGMLVSDYFAISELQGRHRLVSSPAEAARRALDAGVDIETPDPQTYPTLVAQVRSGAVSAKTLDAAVARVLRVKFESGLFDHPFADAATAEARTATPDAIALARLAAQRSIVLLKNDGNLLPLDPRAVGRMLVVGTHASDTPIGGYSDQPRHVVSLLEGLREAAGGDFPVDYAEGVRITEKRVWTDDKVDLVPPEVNRRLIAEAVDKARNADAIVVVVGDNEETSREAWADNHLGDRASLDLVGQQNDLVAAMLATGKKVVVVLLNGRPPSYPSVAAKAPAIVEGWYLGQETGHALADVLLGKVNPGGKLPVTVARNAGQLPFFYNHKPSARRGYLFDDASALFPFGWGLSYTRFTVSAPRLSAARIAANQPVEVAVDVANTGARAGDEVVQLYLHQETSSVTQPVLSLKRFERVTLAPGETRTVRFTLRPDDFKVWNIAMKHVVEPGRFTLYSGPNSVDLKPTSLTIDAAR